MITISSAREAEGEPKVALTSEAAKKFQGRVQEAGAEIAGKPHGGEGIGREHYKMMLDHYTQCKNIFMSLTDTKLGLY